MNIVLWIVQIALALLAVAGGAFKVFSYEELAKVPAAAALSRGAWGGLGVVEMLCGVLLALPAALRWMPGLTPLAAIVLALESVGLAFVYAQYSTELTSTNPLVWVAVMALAAIFVAYGRYRSAPST